MLALSLLFAIFLSSPIDALVVPTVQAPTHKYWRLKDSYNSHNIFQEFEFFTDPDPTNGFVKYVDRATALSQKIVGAVPSANESIYIGVDHHHKAPHGRASVRLTSKKSYNHGLFIVDIEHMPGSICGVWPALWLLGPNWPTTGEVDIIEGVNTMTSNAMTLHTSGKCTLTPNRDFTGTRTSRGCGVHTPGQPPNIGCSISAPASAHSYGSPFNHAGGGIYATEWTSDSITIWFFPRGAIPADLEHGSDHGLRPGLWGRPAAQFLLDCPVDRHFRDMQIVFDTTFCGDWAGRVWAQTPSCRRKASTCEAFVRDKPGEFKEAFWLVNGVRVYQHDV